jgi:hypothetical protein
MLQPTGYAESRIPNLVYACKSLFQVGISHVYREVTIGSWNARSVFNQLSKYGSLIRRLRIVDWCDPKAQPKLYIDILLSVSRFCPNLTSLYISSGICPYTHWRTLLYSDRWEDLLSAGREVHRAETFARSLNQLRESCLQLQMVSVPRCLFQYHTVESLFGGIQLRLLILTEVKSLPPGLLLSFGRLFPDLEEVRLAASFGVRHGGAKEILEFFRLIQKVKIVHLDTIYDQSNVMPEGNKSQPSLLEELLETFAEYNQRLQILSVVDTYFPYTIARCNAEKFSNLAVLELSMKGGYPGCIIEDYSAFLRSLPSLKSLYISDDFISYRGFSKNFICDILPPSVTVYTYLERIICQRGSRLWKKICTAFEAGRLVDTENGRGWPSFADDFTRSWQSDGWSFRENFRRENMTSAEYVIGRSGEYFNIATRHDEHVR